MGKFCGKCGNLIEHCTCAGTGIAPETKPAIKPSKLSYSTVAHLDEIALGEGEQKVKEYLLGKYPMGCGDVRLIVTNKRVILKESYSFLCLSHNKIEELNLESVHGLSGSIGRGMNIPVFIVGLVFALGSVLYGNLFSSMMRYSSFNGMTIFLLVFGLVIMLISCLFPYMTFGITGMGSDHQSLVTGINVNGKTALTNGVVFQPRATGDTRKSIAEAGACIFDLRTYGDAAIEKWTK
ncbi:MAG: hypothetical protein J6M20_01155 [Clostridia bacterium]|nr:hypothetical protein [Clostridia bacterium]